jgi:hypothetical protein
VLEFVVDGIEGGVEVQQHESRLLAFISGMLRVIVHRQCSSLRRMEGMVSRLLDWEQMVDRRTSGETFSSFKLRNERKVGDRPVIVNVVGVHAWFFQIG